MSTRVRKAEQRSWLAKELGELSAVIVGDNDFESGTKVLIEA